MSQVTVLSEKVLQQVLNMPAVMKAVETSYRAKSEKTGILWPMVYETINEHADMDIRSGLLTEERIFGSKLLAWFGSNAEKGLPALNGVINLYDAETGLPAAILNASALSGFRTGAASGVASQYLANPHASTLLLAGTGHQAPYQIMTQLIALPELKEVTLANPIHESSARRAAAEMKDQLESIFCAPIKDREPALAGRLSRRIQETHFSYSTDLAGDVKQADVIITATPSRKPYIQSEWVQPGTHINAIGADMAGKQELDSRLFSRARVFVDDVIQATSVGETQTAIREKLITKDSLREIGDLISGKTAGRTSESDITIFDSTGIALQDLMTAKLALDLADKYGMGTQVEL